MKLSTSLDNKGFHKYADTLDKIIFAMVAEMEDDVFAQKFVEAGYKVNSQQLMEILDRTGANPEAIAQEIAKL